VGVSDGIEKALYTPQAHQQIFHEANTPNFLAWGTRGTGKSITLRWDAIGRCLTFPGFKALILRRKLVDLRKSHLRWIGPEARSLGANYRETTSDVKFENDSFIQFGHCEDQAALEGYLSSEWDYIGFDELSTFTLEQFLKISAAARSITTRPYIALVRACSNPLGPGAHWMKEWFIDKIVDYAEFPDYNPADFDSIFSTLDQNKYVSRKEYEARLKVLPEHVRRAWLYGEFVMEGAYFTDFRKALRDGNKLTPWHVIDSVPTWHGEELYKLGWLKIYRAIDWGYFPDPAVCLWIVVLPNRRAIVFKERTWRRTLAADVAKEIKSESKGMHIVDTFCDPTMFIKHGEASYSIGEIFEQNGIPLSPAQNDRELYGYSIHEYLNTKVTEEVDGKMVQIPLVQILEYACPELVRTIPVLEMDKSDPRKIADGPDHWAVSFAYFAMSQATPSKDPFVPAKPRWMMPKHAHRSIGAV